MGQSQRTEKHWLAPKCVILQCENNPSRGGTASILEVVLFLTLERLKCGTETNLPAYIYIIAVELLSGPSLGVLNVIIWSKFVFYKTPIVKNTIK